MGSPEQPWSSSATAEPVDVIDEFDSRLLRGLATNLLQKPDLTAVEDLIVEDIFDWPRNEVLEINSPASKPGIDWPHRQHLYNQVRPAGYNGSLFNITLKLIDTPEDQFYPMTGYVYHPRFEPFIGVQLEASLHGQRVRGDVIRQIFYGKVRRRADGQRQVLRVIGVNLGHDNIAEALKQSRIRSPR